MGREVRRVPAWWQHPKDRRGYVPLFGRSFRKEVEEWAEGAAKWEEGMVRDWSVRGAVAWKPRPDPAPCETCAEWVGKRPVASDYMPDWTEAERTHLQMYENTSEGTPVSPVMESPEALARWLADNGASAFGYSTATYEQWLDCILNSTGMYPVFYRDVR